MSRVCVLTGRYITLADKVILPRKGFCACQDISESCGCVYLAAELLSNREKSFSNG